jgi:hypothetical protein
VPDLPNLANLDYVDRVNRADFELRVQLPVVDASVPL